MDTTPSIAGVFLQNPQVGGNLTISGVTIQCRPNRRRCGSTCRRCRTTSWDATRWWTTSSQRLIAGHSPRAVGRGTAGRRQDDAGRGAGVPSGGAGALRRRRAVGRAGTDPRRAQPTGGLGHRAGHRRQRPADAGRPRPGGAQRDRAATLAAGDRRRLAGRGGRPDALRRAGVQPPADDDATRPSRAASPARPRRSACRRWRTTRPSPSCRALAPEACAADPEAARALARTVDGLPLALELLGGYLAAPERSYFAELSAAALDELADPARRLQLATRRLGATDDAQVTLRDDHRPEPGGAAGRGGGGLPRAGRVRAQAGDLQPGSGRGGDARPARRRWRCWRRATCWSEATSERLALHQVLADVARTKLEPAAVERHRDYYLALVDEDREDWQRIQMVYPQVMQAWAWQLELQPDDERLLDFYRSLHTYQQRQGLWSDYEESGRDMPGVGAGNTRTLRDRRGC